MMDYKKFKKFGAAVTAAAMFGTLGTGVFAAEDDVDPAEVPSVPVVEAPVVTEAPAVTEAPVVDETPAETEAPEETKAPVETEAPAESTAPDVTEAPAVTEAPEVTEAPAENAEVGLAAAGDGNVLVPDSGNDSAIGITGATAVLDVEKNIYTVTLDYTITGTVSATSQITMLGFVFNGDTTSAVAGEATVETGEIRAIDQQQVPQEPLKRKLTFKLAKASAVTPAADGAPALTVDENTTMVVKLGSDVSEVVKAQAFFIDLANAEEGTPGSDILYGDADESGEVDIDDAVTIYRVILDKTVEKYNAVNADVEIPWDEVDIDDAVAIYRWILDKGTLPASPKPGV